MIFVTLIKESLAALWANRLRSFLTVLGMTMGVTSVIAIVSTVEGMQGSLEDAFASLGSNTFMVTRFGFGLSMQEYLERMHRRKLTRSLIEPIKEGCPDCAEVGAEAYSSSTIKYGSKRMSWINVEGNTPNILAMRDLDVAMGRYISWEDDSRRKQVAFIGHKIYEKLFEGMNAIGEKIRIGKDEFVVIGVAEALGGMLGGDMDEFVAIPLSTHQKMYQQAGNPVNLVISSVSLERREQAMDQVRVVLRSARHVNYDDNDDFAIVTPDAILSFINDFTRGFRIVLVSLPLLSIIIGGIVIMNIMMISVTERTREIGIRKAIGARRRHILTQFLYESTFLSLVGGALGILFGVLIGEQVLTGLLDIYVTPTTLAIVLGFGISMGVGLFFGIYPAVRASRFDPIKALSYD